MFVLCLGTLEIRELYALMMMRLPWALCLKEFWICNPRMSVLIKVYIDLAMSAMLFRKPECGNYLDILGVGEIHMLEFFCGQARHQLSVLLLASCLPTQARLTKAFQTMGCKTRSFDITRSQDALHTPVWIYSGVRVRACQAARSTIFRSHWGSCWRC